MRITGWHVDGFGIFHDWRVGDLPPGLTVIEGPNEAGKSTLLAFLRGVLFGFPDGRSREPAPPALAGGRHGGRLFLSEGGGTVIVERSTGNRAAVVTLSDGSRGTPADLALLLGNLDREVYQRVFAFSLRELADLDSLEGERIRERIYAAGVLGSGTSPKAALDSLRQRQQSLLGPRSGRLRELARRLLEKEGEARDAHREAGAFPELLRQEQEIRQRLERARDLREEERRKRERFRLLRDLWETWRRLQAKEEELAGMRIPEGIPEGALELLTRLEADLENGRSHLEDKRREQGREQKALDNLSVDEHLLPYWERFSRLQEQVPLMRKLSQELPGLQEEAEGAQTAAREALAALSADMTPERLSSLEVTVELRDRLAAWQQQISDLQQDLREAQRKEEHLRQEARKREQEREDAEEDIRRLPPTPEPETLKSQRIALEILDKESDRLSRLEEEVRLAEAQGQGGRGIPASVRWLLVAAAAVAGAVGFGLLVLLPGQEAGGLLLVGAVFLSATAALLPGGTRHGETAQLLEQAAARRREAGALRQRLEEAARQLGVDLRPGEASVNREALIRVRLRLEDQEKSLEERRQREQEAGKAQKRREQAQAEVAAAAAKVATGQGETSLAEEGFRAFLREKGYPVQLSPEGALHMFRAADTARERLRTAARAGERRDAVRTQLEDWTMEVGSLFADLGRQPPGSPQEALERLPAWYEECRENREREQERRRRAATLKEREQEVAASAEKVGKTEEALEALLREAGVATPQELRQRVETMQSAGSLRQEIGSLRETLEDRLGHRTDREEILSDLPAGTLDVWEEGERQAGTEQEATEGELEQALGDLRDAENRRKEMADSEKVASLEQEAETHRQELFASTRSWAALALAVHLLESTLSRFERERQPAVLHHASGLFRTITGQRYQGVLQQSGEEQLAVWNESGGRLPVRVLSTGTQQQLYLALRLGLVRHFAEQSTAVPLVMDDVLVNFDPERARRSAEALAQLASEQQILFFTCHPAFRSLMLEAVPDAHWIQLETMAVSV